VAEYGKYCTVHLVEGVKENLSFFIGRFLKVLLRDVQLYIKYLFNRQVFNAQIFNATTSDVNPLLSIFCFYAIHSY
jgi:hypothetical protein